MQDTQRPGPPWRHGWLPIPPRLDPSYPTGGLDDELAFPLHAEAARRYLAQAGASGSGFVSR